MPIIVIRTLEIVCSSLPKIVKALERIADHMENAPRCCLCGKPLNGMGNNADPIADGRCCDDCNISFVIPARMKNFKEDK